MKTYFPFSLCCCIGKRTSSLIIGVVDVIIGLLCILSTVGLLVENISEQRALDDAEPLLKAQDLQELIAGFVLILIACGVPALITFFLGIFSIYATATNNRCLSSYSLALNIILVIGLIGIDVFLFCLGLQSSVLITYLVATGVQIYFCLILYDYYQYTSRNSNSLHSRSTRRRRKSNGLKNDHLESENLKNDITFTKEEP